MDIEAKIKELEKRNREAELGGGQKRIDQQHAKGKMTARERLDYLLDEGSFQEIDKFVVHRCHDFGMEKNKIAGDGVVTGHGTVNGRPVFLFSQDFTVFGGSLSGMFSQKACKVMDPALKNGTPMIGLDDSGGARIQEGVESLGGYGEIFKRNVWSSGVIPQISVIMGTCAGISVYSPALTDFIFMVDKTSHMFITGPAMVKSVMGENVDTEQLGGAKMHCQISGVCDRRFPNEKECLDGIRELLSYLPENTDTKPPVIEMDDDSGRLDENLIDIIPPLPNKPYDMHKVICSLVDRGHFFELKPEFAGEIIVGFGRLDDQVVGIVGNQPMVRAGSLTVDSSDKQSRFIRFCDCFNIPIVLLVDTLAYLPGRDQEQRGIIRHGAKVIHALCEATVPRIAIVLRKSYGGGNLGMGVLPGLGTDQVYYWPIGEVGVLGAEASVELFFGKEIRDSENPKEMKEERLKEYIEKYSNPMREASANWNIDDIIEPRETRKVLIQRIEISFHKKAVPKASQTSWKYSHVT